jgi:hypothetical protein
MNISMDKIWVRQVKSLVHTELRVVTKELSYSEFLPPFTVLMSLKRLRCIVIPVTYYLTDALSYCCERETGMV